MLRFIQGFGRSSSSKAARLRRSRTFSTSLETMEERKLLTSLAAVSFNSGGTMHSEVFTINFDNTVSMSKDNGAFVSLGGYCKAISAGLDSAGNPEVYAIGGDNAVWANDNGAGWVSRGGYALAISASVQNTVFAIGGDNATYINRSGTSWGKIGGYCKSISAGTDWAGFPEVYAIGGDNSVWSSDNGLGYVYRGGYALAISASVHNTVFAIGGDHAAYVNSNMANWTNLGGWCRGISAGVDSSGNPELFAIGSEAAVWSNLNGSGFTKVGGYATDISAAGCCTVFARGGTVDQLFGSQYSAPFKYIGSSALVNPASATGYSPAPASAPLFNGGTPSYLDMQQGAVGDCWLDASLAEVAARAPQDIKNMFVYNGTTTDNGATVGLYSVLLFEPNGIGFYVKVDTALPNGGSYYNHVANALGPQSRWTALAEKAYAEANTLGFVTTGNKGANSYAALGGGDPSWALQAITGNSANSTNLNTGNIVNAWNAGQFVVLCTSSPSSSYIVGNHCYAMVGYNASSGLPFQIFNPWGTQSDGYAPGQSGKIYGLFNANAPFVSQNFAYQGIGSSAPNEIIVQEPEDKTTLEPFGFKKSSLVLGKNQAGLAVNNIRPILGMATVGGPRA